MPTALRPESLTLLACLLSLFCTCAVAGESPAEPRLVRDDSRAVMDLAGVWEACPATPDLAFPPPAEGWSAHPVPHTDTKFLDSDGIGPYFPRGLEAIFAADGRTPKRTDKLAVWFRRNFTLETPVAADTRALLHCDGIAWHSELWLNGTKIGGSDLGMAPNTYDVTTALKPGKNELVIGVAGRWRLWNPELKTFIAPITGVMPGIWDNVRLELVPAFRVEDVFVKPSVQAKHLAVEITLANDGPAARSGTPGVVILDPAGQPRLVLAGSATEVPAGGRIPVTLAADWLADQLWAPGTPNLYRCRATLQADGAEADRRSETFGFRDFTARDRDFLLNGRRQVLLRNSWLTSGSQPRERVLPNVRDEITNYNCIRLHLSFINPHVIDQADRIGLLVIPEFWGFYQNSNLPFPITQAAAWTPNTAETMRRVIKRYRNHPSVIMWSVTNETFWNSTAPEHLTVADQLVKAIRAADSTRLLQADAEITYDGRLDTISIHYPESDTGTIGKQYDNSGWIVPNDFAWLKKEGSNHSWRADFIWDRPLMIGEYFCQDGDEPERYTPYAGDEAYELTKWRWQALNGRDALLPRPDNAWIQMVKMSTDHYRAAGVAALNPWTGLGRQLMPALLIAPLDYFPTAFGGEEFTRKFVVANDHTIAWPGMHLQVGLLLDGRELWSERKIPAQVDPGEHRELDLTLHPPAVAQQQAARLIVRLCWMRGPVPYELARHEEDLWIAPHENLAEVETQSLALVDTNDGLTVRALAEMKLNLTPGPVDDAALTGKKLLIIGEGAAAGADLAAVARFAERGGRVLVMHQTELAAFVPSQPEIDPKHAASISWRQAAHPALAGLADGQLRFWRPDHLVVRETLVRPAVGAAASQAVCGGRYGLHWSPLVELRCGKGAVTFCQYLLAEKVAIEPAAERILAQAIRSALAAEPAAPAPALRLAPGVTKETKQALATCFVKTTEDSVGDGPVLLDAAHAPEEKVLQRLRAQVEAGRVLWLRGLNEKTAPAVAGLLPWTPGFVPLAKEVVGAVRRGEHPFLAGLSSGDFYWARGAGGSQPTTSLGGPVLLPPTLGAAVLLVEPALLAVVPVGQGWILIDQLGWDQALAAETERATRIVSCLARNLGAGFSPPVDVSRRYRFTPVDLSSVANRGYVDEAAGDGRGGWTDQGENDMRFFLINHVGTADGRPGGMAVAGEPFPAEVKLQGIAYRLLDPKNGKAVLTLRGGPHDPAAPAEARGIPLNSAKADRIWFLHTGCWGSEGGYGVEVARYEIIYADGSKAEIPVRQGLEINDWWNPKPLAGAQVAWTGRNLKAAPIGLYSLAWDNPHPDRPLASLNVIGNLAQTQLVLLAATLGVDEGGAKAVAAWECGRFAAGQVPAAVGSAPLTGEGTPAAVGDRTGLRLTNGQCLSANPQPNPLASGQPLAVEIEVAPDGPPGGYYGGLFECGNYQNAGLRLVLRQDLRVVVEHWAGAGPKSAFYFISREPLPPGRFSRLRYEHDGRQGRLLVDGKIQELKECPLPAPYKEGLRLGLAGGKDYWFNGVIGSVRLLQLATDSSGG